MGQCPLACCLTLSLMYRGGGSFQKRGLFPVALQKSWDAWAPFYGPEGAGAMSSSVSARAHRGLALSCMWRYAGKWGSPPLRNLGASSSPGTFTGAKRPQGSLSPAALLPLSRPQAPDNTGKALSAGSLLPPGPRGPLHTDSWQPAPCDKLIRPNLSPAAQHSPCPRFPSSCLPAPPPPSHWALLSAWLLAGSPSQPDPPRPWEGLMSVSTPLLTSQGLHLWGPSPPAKEVPGVVFILDFGGTF